MILNFNVIPNRPENAPKKDVFHLFEVKYFCQNTVRTVVFVCLVLFVSILRQTWDIRDFVSLFLSPQRGQRSLPAMSRFLPFLHVTQFGVKKRQTKVFDVSSFIIFL